MTNQNTAIAKQDAQKKERTQVLAKLIESRREAFALVAGEHFKPERLVKLAQGALARQPKLAECTPSSVLVALMRCAELELEPDSALPQRRMWLVPRWNNKLGANECTYMMDYRAQIQKARETGLVPSVIASGVQAKDRFTLRYDADGTSITKFEFEPGGEGGIFAERGDVIGYFAAARLEGGEVQIAAMSKRDAEAFRDKRAPRDRQNRIVGPWVSDFDAMAVKSCLRKLWNLLPAGKSEAARRLQERMQEEADIHDAGKAVAATAPIELDLGIVPEDQDGDTASAVERQIAGGDGQPPPGAPADAPLDDVSFETAEEEAARKEREVTGEQQRPAEPPPVVPETGKKGKPQQGGKTEFDR
jgi:recombination protein RecT